MTSPCLTQLLHVIACLRRPLPVHAGMGYETLNSVRAHPGACTYRLLYQYLLAMLGCPDTGC
jgi:hypothetical protein